MTRTLLLRADASLKIGFGHVLRCLAIAQAWQDAGGQAIFACAELPEMLQSRFEAENCAFVPLETHIRSLDDAAQTQEIAAQLGAQWVVCDGYNFDGNFLRALKNEAFSLLSLDDFSATDLEAADAICNPNAGASVEFYAHFASKTQILTGQKFALLRREFRLQNRSKKLISEKIERVLIAMGGADVGDLAPRALQWLQNQNFRGEVVVLCGAREFDFPHFEFDLKIVRAQNEVPQWMHWCDVAIAAAGSATWELACCGVPALLSVVAGNQRELARWCEENGVAISLGEAGEEWENRLNGAWQRLENPTARREMSLRAQNAIDGQGAARLVQHLWPQSLQLRPATLDDAALLWEWRNDAQTLVMSLQSEPVNWETHLTWLSRKLRDPNAIVLVARSLEGAPLGQIRFDWKDERAEIDITVNPQRRGQGWGAAILEAGLMRLWEQSPVKVARATVKIANSASRHLFERAGFVRCEAQTNHGEMLEIFEKTRPNTFHGH